MKTCLIMWHYYYYYYYTDNIGLHRVENPSHTKGAITLHLYTPPYR